ncbi:MAG: hypothetical protein ACRDI0_07825 [Actinomycetota bacterium]
MTEVAASSGPVVVALLALVVFVVLLVVGRRHDDEAGRPGGLSIYLAAAMVVTLVVTLLSLGAATSALVRQALGPSGTTAVPGVPARPIPGVPVPAPGPSATAELVGALVTAALAGGLFEFHRRRFRQLRAAEGPAGPAGSVYRSYLYAVCLASAVVVIVAGGRAALGATRAIAPGDRATVGVPDESRVRPGRAASPASQPERDAGAVQVLEGGVLFAAAAGVWVYHWRRTQDLPPEPEPEGP